MVGKLITFEGIDGCGKSTQARLLYDNLKRISTKCILTREPGGSKGAEEIRKLLVTGTSNRWSAETEILLFTAARRDHLERTISPGLRDDKIVISDRFFDSTKIYQGAARSDLVELAETLHHLTIKLIPNLTFVIDMEPKRALKRGLDRFSGEDRFEEFGLNFQKKLRAGFIELTKKENKRCHLINGDNDPQKISKEIFQIYSDHSNG
ncbi:MAG: dTMP kinase [Paracoccaceae bacterium]|nr:dTMP kinase [Paracoccaceae bacterium]